jgi:hypothetical protein
MRDGTAEGLDPATLRAMAAERTARRAAGVPLTGPLLPADWARVRQADPAVGPPTAPAPLPTDERREDEVETKCDDLVTAAGGVVVRLSQRRASRIHEGLPDRRYRVGAVVFWWECKAAKGKLSRAQLDFLEGELACGQLGGVGTDAELGLFLRALAGGQPLAPLSLSLVRRWAARGLRAERAA